MTSPPESSVPSLGGWGRSNLLWLAVSLVMLVLLAVAAGVVIADTDQPLPPFLKPGSRPSPTPAGESQRTDGLRMAGSGSNLPLTRALSTAFPRDESHHPVVHASIGSGGGIRALLDGVIDIALISRPLRESEREQGLVATPYARVPIVVAAHTSVTEQGLRADQLPEIYRGTQRTWTDGSRVVVLQRERGDSSHAAVSRVLPGFDEANEASYRDSRWRVLYRDDAMREALADTLGAIGLFGQGAIPDGLPVKALAVDGVMPSPETVRDGSYPFTKDFSFVTRGAPSKEARSFIDFALGPTGRQIIEAAGGLPLDGGPMPPAPPRRPPEALPR